MPCAAISPTIHMPHTYEPKHTAPPVPVSASVYERLWQFLLHHWHSQPQPLSQEKKSRRRSTSRLSAASEMRCRVRMLHELETQPRDGDDDIHSHSQSYSHSHSRNAMQTTCCNCGQRFFRDLGTASSPCDPTEISSSSSASSSSTYCSLDCRSSFEYREAIQHAVDHHTAFGDSSSSTVTSRL